MRALVIGGSLGGLFAANLLARAGWDVEVFERVGGELAGRGAGIVTHPELHEALARAGAVVDETLGVKVEDRVTLARDGSVLGRRPLSQILTAWSRLYHLLKEALPRERYRFGWTLERVEQDSRGVTARFANGERVHGDLLVAADGIRSTVRGQLAPEVGTQYAGYIAWRGLVEEPALSVATHAALFEHFAFCLPPREQMLGYPVAGGNNTTRPGKRRWNFVWYRPADGLEALPRLLTDSKGRTYDMSIPPDRIRPEAIELMRRAAEEVLAPQFAEVVAKTEHPFFQPIYDLESPQLAFGRVALVGDAAFVARPHVGMGVTKAAADALALVECLAQHADVERALAAYNALRQPYGAFVIMHARRLGAYMQAQVRTRAEREAAERYRTPEAVMRETAVQPVPDASVARISHRDSG
jgi:2-polyprenyl-6-methoxyphenol hydroxylase-like FAD-dependent oxidoreductase